MTIAPTITVSTTPGLQVNTGSALSYAAILNSLGAMIYQLDMLYYKSSTYAQFSNPVQYAKYDANGDQNSNVIVTPISPVQWQPVMYLRPKDAVFEGQSSLNFNMNPGQVEFIFYASRLSNEDPIDRAGFVNNFRDLEARMGKPGFFKMPNEDGE